MIKNEPGHWKESELADWVDGNTLPEKEGVFITEDSECGHHFFNVFQNGQWHWGYGRLEDVYSELEVMQLEVMPQANVTRWRGLAQ